MKIKKLSLFAIPENAFVTIGIIFGILFLLITPPFQAADEYAHYYRAFQISEGHFVAERQQNQVGGLLPKSLVTTSERVSSGIPFHPEIKQNPKDIFSLLNLPLASRNRAFVHFPNTSLYSPISYLPQATGIALGKIIGFSPITLTYVGRLFNLLFWLVIGYFSIKLTPVFKWAFVLLALTPMSLFQAASLSADGVTNSISLLLIAVFLRSALDKSKILKTLDIIIIFVLASSLAIAKQAYFPLVFLFLLIPIRKFENKKRYFITFALLLLLSLAAIVAWSLFTKELYIPLQPNVSPGKQLLFIVDNPLEFFRVILNTFSLNGAHYIDHFIGTLGWLDTDLPDLFINSYVVMLIFVSLVSSRKDIAISYRQKIIILLTLLLSGIIVITLIYFSWTAVGAGIIEGIQGRYFIPIAPLLFLLLYNRKIQLDMRIVGLVVVLYCLFSATLTTSILWHRYYL